MNLQKYRYTGPISSMILQDGREQRLTPGALLTLSKDDFFTKRLLEQGCLIQLETQDEELPVQTVQKEDPNEEVDADPSLSSKAIKTQTKQKGRANAD